MKKRLPHRTQHVSLALLLTVVVFLSLGSGDPARAEQYLYWDDGFSSTFTTFGPNASVTIAVGSINYVCEGFSQTSDIYVIASGGAAPGQPLRDVSNGHGVPNTVIASSGGFFIHQTIGYANTLGSGLYAVVYDECQDGVFTAGEDFIVDPAFEVNVPADVGDLSPAIQDLKTTCDDLSMSMYDGVTLYSAWWDGAEYADFYAKCLISPTDCAIKFLINKLVSEIKSQLEAQISKLLNQAVLDPKAAAKKYMTDVGKHYEGIAADPPDSSYRELTVLSPVSVFNAPDSDMLTGRLADYINSAATEAALAEALLTAIERYQGADLESNGDGALIQAYAAKKYAALLAAQLPHSNAALSALRDVIAAQPWDPDLAAELDAWSDRVENDGFDAQELAFLKNIEQSDEIIDALRNTIAARDYAATTPTLVVEALSNHMARNTQAVAVLEALVDDMDGLIDALKSDPFVLQKHPLADAGGPYTATVGIPADLDGSASTDHLGTVDRFEWDLNRDGVFDDAVGANPSVIFEEAFDGLIALRVTNSAGWQAVDYARVSIAGINSPPTIDGFLTEDGYPQMLVGETLDFSINASDADSDTITASWYLDGVWVGDGDGYSYHPSDSGDAGVHLVHAIIADDSPYSGSVVNGWTVSVLMPDGDGDLWRANVDCDDGDPLVNPGESEIVANGKDDDCNPDTFDMPPIAAFSVSPDLIFRGDTVQFNDESTPRAGSIVLWDWDFGNGQTSSLPSPTHVYTDPGVYMVTLTVTDSAGARDAAGTSLAIVDPPTASIYVGPSRNVALLEDGAGIVDASGHHSTHFPEYAIDADMTTQWYSDAGQITDQWLTVALTGGQAHLIDGVRIRGSGGTSGIRHFEVLVSNSGTADADFSVVASGAVPMDQELHEFSFSPVPARYVKLFAQDNWGYVGRLVVAAFQVWTPQRQLGAVSLLEGPPASISDHSSSLSEALSPENLLDDRSATRWATADNQIIDQWVTVDLPGEAAFTIGGVALRGVLTDRCPRDFEIRVSTQGPDPGDFSTVLTGTLGQSADVQSYDLTPTPARYVQLFIHDNYGGDYIDLYAFDILTPDGANLSHSRGVGAFVMDVSSGNDSEQAIDFSTSTDWQTERDDVTDQWLTVRLIEGGPYLVDSIVLMGARNASSPRNFQVRVSADTLAESDFVTVLSGVLPQDGLSHWFTFPAAAAKYVQLVVEDNYGGVRISVFDFKVFTSTRGGLTFAAGDVSEDADGAVVDWQWDFGDGTIMTEPNASHTYAQPGAYTVTLTVTDNDGLSDSVSMPYTALPSLAVDFSWDPLLAVEREDTTLTGIFTGSHSLIVDWIWTFDHISQSFNNPVTAIKFPDNGDYAVTLTVIDSRLFSASVTKTISAANLPPAVTISDRTTLWGDPIRTSPSVFDSAADRSTLNFLWEMGNGDTSTERYVDYTYNNPGIYAIRLSVTDKDGAVGTDTATVTVNKRPTTLEYIGNISADQGSTALLRAKLLDSDNGAKIADKEIIFTFNGATHTSVTNSIGIAQFYLTPDLAPGTYDLPVRFDEDEFYLGDQDESTLTVPGLVTIREPGYSSMVFTVSDVVFFSYADNTLLELHDAGGNLIWNNDGIPLDKGGHAHVAVDEGVYRAAGSQKFAVLTGDPITQYVCGYYAMDQNGFGTSTEFFTWVPKTYRTPPDTESKFIVFAYEDDTHVTVEYTDTGEDLAVLTLNAGDHWEVTDISEAFLHVVADKPVSALTSYDQGFYVPSATGRWSGTRFYTYVGYVGAWSQDLTVMAYHDDTFVTIANSETGEPLWSGMLDSGEVQVERFRVNRPLFHDPRQYITVTSSDTVTVSVQPWISYTDAYHQGAYVQNLTGSGMGAQFIGSTLEAGYLYLLGYNEDTIVDIFDSQTGEWVDSDHVNRGEFVEINPGNGVWRIESDKYVSAYSGWGDWNAEFSPVEFGDVFNPVNLTKDDGIDADGCVAPAETITYEICFDNAGGATEYHQVTLSDVLPPETRFVSATGGGVYDPSGRVVRWDIGDLPADAVRQCLQVAAAVDAGTPLGGTIGNTVNMFSRETNRISRSVETRVCATVNSPPLATDDTFSMAEDAVLTVAPPGCLSNDSDPNGDSLTAELVDATTRGTLDFTGDGGFVFRPDADFNGQDTFRYRVSDGRAWSDPATVTITVASVNDPPVANAGGPYTVAEGVDLTLDGSGSSDPEGDALTFEWDLDEDGTADTAGVTPTRAWLQDGIHTVTLYVSDGHTRVSDTATVTVTDRGPQAAFSWAPDPQLEGGDIAFNDASTTPNDAIVAWSWDFGGLGGSTDRNPAFAFGADGSYSVSLTITDHDGSQSTAQHVVTVADRGPTALLAGDTVLDEGQSGAYDAGGSSSWPDGIASFAWDWSYAGIFTPSGHDGATGSRQWSDDGTHTIAVQVTDDDGSTDMATLVVTVSNVAPLVSAGDDQTVEAGDPVAYTGSFMDPGADDTHIVAWDFGDGGSAAGSLDPVHTYAVQGTYTVTLTVIDDDGGTGSDSMTITVGEAQPICGDLDHDGDVDGIDRNIFRSALGSSTGDAAYIDDADYDRDGDIDYTDYQLWYQCYRRFITS